MYSTCLQVFNNKDHVDNLYGEKVEVDYRGYEVTVENFLRVLTGGRQYFPRHDSAGHLEPRALLGTQGFAGTSAT